jgi:hypothetical protein
MPRRPQWETTLRRVILWRHPYEGQSEEKRSSSTLCVHLQPTATICILDAQNSVRVLVQYVYPPPPSVEEEKSPLTWGSGYRRSNLQRALSGSPPHHNDSISLLVRIPPLRGGFIARHSVTPGLGVLRGSGDRTNRCPSNSYSFAVAAASRYPFTCAGKQFRTYFTLSGLTTKGTSVLLYYLILYTDWNSLPISVQ